jgi:hypothetical protein
MHADLRLELFGLLLRSGRGLLALPHLGNGLFGDVGPHPLVAVLLDSGFPTT